MLKKDQIAPDFTLLDQNKTEQTLSRYRGQWVLVYFYPMDDTPGCTKEACTIAEIYDEFKALGVVVLGISKDSPESHLVFAQKYNLPFTLLSDPALDIAKAYGAAEAEADISKTKASRISYLINPTGTIAQVYPAVDPATHAVELLKDIKELQN